MTGKKTSESRKKRRPGVRMGPGLWFGMFEDMVNAEEVEGGARAKLSWETLHALQSWVLYGKRA